MRNFLSKFRWYRFSCYWLVSWIEYYNRLQVIDEFENANYHRLKLLKALRENDYIKM